VPVRVPVPVRIAPSPVAPALDPTVGAPPTRDEVKQYVDDYMEERSLFAPVPEDQRLERMGSLIDLSVILDTTVGTSQASDGALSEGIALGDHDPHVRGFNARNEEFVVTADVDPYFYGLLDVVYKLSEEGESVLELEEAYALSTSLPAGLQLKIGQFFTEFGRMNPVHPHAWQFLDYPVILGRVFGADGLRGQGLRVSWIVPSESVPLTVFAGVQNAVGDTQAPFFGADGDVIGNHEQQRHGVDSLGDFAWHVRVEGSHDFAGVHDGTLSVLGGVSVGLGPNGTGSGGRSRVYGADLFFKWKADRTEAGWPWIRWQTEYVSRHFEADGQDRDLPDGMGGLTTVHVDPFTYKDSGFYTELVFGFTRPWSLGVRYDHAMSNGAFAGDHDRISGALTYYPSEFSRIRLQVGYDDVQGLSTDHPGQDDGNFSVWLNFDYALGKHGAHKF